MVQIASKEDIAANPIYRMIARTSLREMHDSMLSHIYHFLNQRPGKRTLVVIGQGPEAVPFSRNLDMVASMVGDGNICMFDYNPTIISETIDALRHPRFSDDELDINPEKRKGIEEHGFTIEHLIDDTSVLDLKALCSKKAIIRAGNAAETFKLADNSVSVIDATLVFHHVTAFTQGLHHVIDECHRVLEPGGMLHWGDGIVTMRYQEMKLHQLCLDLLSVTNSSPLLLHDMRDPDSAKRIGDASMQHCAIYEPGKPYDLVPLVSIGDYDSYMGHDLHGNLLGVILVFVIKDGFIHISVPSPHSRSLAQYEAHLREKGYKQVFSMFPSTLVLPLIDVGMQRDRDEFLESVTHYYNGIKRLNATNFSDRPEIAAKVLEADNKEFGDAARGLFEYYTDPQILRNSLNERGFRVQQYTPCSDGVWFNLFAVKK